MNQTISRSSDMSNFASRVLGPLTRSINPRIMRLAGGRWFPTFSVLHHRGYKSGRMYATPISALPRGEYFWVSLAFGEEAGWVRNILAAGECVIRHRARDYRLIEPAVLDASTVLSQLPRLMRIGLPIVGAEKVLRLRKAGRN
jgi:deazaflavin-dependent oxidoreductase (nitroreductase family)